MSSMEQLVVRLPGELTMENVEGVRREIMAELSANGVLDAPVGLIMDLSNVEIVTTPGLGLILEFRRRVLSAGGRVFVASASSSVEDVIRRTQLDRVLELTPNVATAKAQLAGPAKKG